MAGRRGVVARVATLIATAGGLTLLATALLTSFSVARRWATSQPVQGDFELVSLGSGLSVLAFLAYGTLKRANILVDSFTTWLPRRPAQLVDAFWMLVWAAVAVVLAERLLVGAQETLRTGTTTMVLGLPTWWAVGFGACGFALTAVAALLWVVRLAQGKE
jgi:TRAP-type C4-dicarboxylate transport system permease small subunit